MCGSNLYGQLGVGKNSKGKAAIDSFELGCSHSAFLGGGHLYVFGANSDGQLGLGDTR